MVNLLKNRCINIINGQDLAYNKHIQELSADKIRLIEPVEFGIQQLLDSKGLEIETPVELPVDAFYELLRALRVKIIKRKSHYKFLGNEYIIDEFIVSVNEGELKIYNKVSIVSYKKYDNLINEILKDLD